MGIFEEINSELNSLYTFCTEQQMSDEEIKMVFASLLKDDVEKKNSKKRFIIISIIVVFIISFLYINSDLLATHATALSRIALIKMLPYWNWMHLKNEQCLINYEKTDEAHKQPLFNCALCEAISKTVVSAEADIDPDTILEDYLKLDHPLLIKNVSKTNIVLKDIAEDPILSLSAPCKLQTNLHSGYRPSLKKLLLKTERFESFFLHFSNCELDAVRNFRIYVPRPKYLADEISPIQYSWLLMSRNYNVTKFKRLDIVERFGIFEQIDGSNLVSLYPISDCEEDCVDHQFEVEKGDVLLFTNLWEFEYRPKEGSSNVAVLLEAH